MVKSMTGYGSAFREDADFRIAVEIKTLNSKFLDLNFRPLKILNEKEPVIRSMVTDYLQRGKVNLIIEIEEIGENNVSKLFNEVLFKKYYEEIKTLANSVGAPENELLRIVLSQPDVSKSSGIVSTPEKLWTLVNSTLKEALNSCNGFREKEGAELQKYLFQNAQNIGKNRSEIAGLEKSRSVKIRERIKSNLNQMIEQQELIDQNRLEQEIIYYLEKLDIHEELDRLSTHLDHFENVLNHESLNGKKLGFLSQEIGREINTIGSKANDAEIQKFVVMMKEDLEKIKEQTLNIL